LSYPGLIFIVSGIRDEGLVPLCGGQNSKELYSELLRHLEWYVSLTKFGRTETDTTYAISSAMQIPELQRRVLFRTEYEGQTLWENLGLPRPVNQFTANAATP
jgi:hypothetical protein